jgi:hypothetical protein
MQPCVNNILHYYIIKYIISTDLCAYIDFAPIKWYNYVTDSSQSRKEQL